MLRDSVTGSALEEYCISVRIVPKQNSAYPVPQDVQSKIEEILNSESIEHYKNLRYDMKDRKRVHIGHFVLVFKLIETENKIIFVDFDHHDNIYD